MFDKMQRLGPLKYTISHTFLNFSVFGIYNTNAKRERKECAVINIRKLNDFVIPNAYPLPLQSYIIPSI